MRLPDPADRCSPAGRTAPFFFGYILLLGAGSLWAAGIGPVVLALVTSVAYLVAVVLSSGRHCDGPRQSAASPSTWSHWRWSRTWPAVIGREQRRAREEALRLSRFDSLTSLHSRGFFDAAVEQEILAGGRAPDAAFRAADVRPRRPEGGQRSLRARLGRPPAPGRCRRHARRHPRHRRCGALRRRRVRPAAARDGSGRRAARRRQGARRHLAPGAAPQRGDDPHFGLDRARDLSPRTAAPRSS